MSKIHCQWNFTSTPRMMYVHCKPQYELLVLYQTLHGALCNDKNKELSSNTSFQNFDRQWICHLAWKAREVVRSKQSWIKSCDFILAIYAKRICRNACLLVGIHNSIRHDAVLGADDWEGGIVSCFRYFMPRGLPISLLSWQKLLFTKLRIIYTIMSRILVYDIVCGHLICLVSPKHLRNEDISTYLRLPFEVSHSVQLSPQALIESFNLR